MTLPAVNWAISAEKIPYEAAVAFMEDRAAAIARGEAEELVWLLEHDPLYTAGTSSKPEDLLSPDRFPVFETGRGGEYTYHGPGQRVAYVMLDLTRRNMRDFTASHIPMELLFRQRVRLAAHAPSVGGLETLVSVPARSSHATMPREDRARLGITDGLVRVSVGVEDVDDLLADFEAALGPDGEAP